MRIQVDTTGAEESGEGFVLLPEGDYRLQIIGLEDSTTSKGDPMIKVVYEVVGKGEFAGRNLWDNIVVPKQGSPSFKIMGRTMHFLHCIGERHEGQFEINTDKWKGRVVLAKVGTASYTDKNGQAKLKNEIQNYILEPTDASENIPF